MLSLLTLMVNLTVFILGGVASAFMTNICKMNAQRIRKKALFLSLPPHKLNGRLSLASEMSMQTAIQMRIVILRNGFDGWVIQL